MGDAWRETVVVAITEFGRTAHINGNGGTDHGTATVALLAGGALKGGRVIADCRASTRPPLPEPRPEADDRFALDHEGAAQGPFARPRDRSAATCFPDNAAAPSTTPDPRHLEPFPEASAFRGRCSGPRAVTPPRRASSLQHLADRGDDPLAVREDMAFEDGAVGDRHLQGADPLHRGLEPREGRPASRRQPQRPQPRSRRWARPRRR